MMCLDLPRRLRAAPGRARTRSRDYFFRRLGWLDLLGSLPVPGLRLFRIVRVVRLVHELRRKGGRRMVREISARAGRGGAVRS